MDKIVVWSLKPLTAWRCWYRIDDDYVFWSLLTWWCWKYGPCSDKVTDYSAASPWYKTVSFPPLSVNVRDRRDIKFEKLPPWVTLGTLIKILRSDSIPTLYKGEADTHKLATKSFLYTKSWHAFYNLNRDGARPGQINLAGVTRDNKCIYCSSSWPPLP
jgi:hypothetical protein